VVNSLAAVNLLEDCRLFIETVAWNDDRDRHADRLLGAKAEKPLRAIVPAEDHAVEILRQDGVIGGFDNGLVVLRRANATAAGRTPSKRRSRRRPVVGRLTSALQSRVPFRRPVLTRRARWRRRTRFGFDNTRSRFLVTPLAAALSTLSRPLERPYNFYPGSII